LIICLCVGHDLRIARRGWEVTLIGEGQRLALGLARMTIVIIVPAVSNSLPRTALDCVTLSAFKSKLKTFLFSHTFTYIRRLSTKLIIYLRAPTRDRCSLSQRSSSSVYSAVLSGGSVGDSVYSARYGSTSSAATVDGIAAFWRIDVRPIRRITSATSVVYDGGR